MNGPLVIGICLAVAVLLTAAFVLGDGLLDDRATRRDRRRLADLAAKRRRLSQPPRVIR